MNGMSDQERASMIGECLSRCADRQDHTVGLPVPCRQLSSLYANPHQYNTMKYGAIACSNNSNGGFGIPNAANNIVRCSDQDL